MRGGAVLPWSVAGGRRSPPPSQFSSWQRSYWASPTPGRRTWSPTASRSRARMSADSPQPGPRPSSTHGPMRSPPSRSSSREPAGAGRSPRRSSPSAATGAPPRWRPSAGGRHGAVPGPQAPGASAPRLRRRADRARRRGPRAPAARVIAKQVDVDGREAAIVLRNGQPVVIPGEASRKLDAAAAGKAIVAALAALEREEPVALPIKTTPPAVGQDALAAVAQQVRIALSGPVILAYKGVHLRSPQSRSPRSWSCRTASELRIGSPRCQGILRQPEPRGRRAPREVDFSVDDAGRRT